MIYQLLVRLDSAIVFGICVGVIIRCEDIACCMLIEATLCHMKTARLIIAPAFFVYHLQDLLFIDYVLLVSLVLFHAYSAQILWLWILSFILRSKLIKTFVFPACFLMHHVLHNLIEIAFLNLLKLGIIVDIDLLFTLVNLIIFIHKMPVLKLRIFCSRQVSHICMLSIIHAHAS